jgi:DtxR family Mn-dependent transcriptional regulator
MGAATAHSSTAVQNYLKVIFSLGERDDAPVTTSRLAERVGVSTSSASGMIRRLAELGLVEHRRYSSIRLTVTGRTQALRMVRRHRLLETFLVVECGYRWDEVHDEAEELEHAVSETFLERIDAKLGHPTRDPHGDPIPGPDGRIETLPARRLTTVAPGDRGTLVRVDDIDPDVLRELDSLGVALGAPVEALRRLPFDGPYLVRIDGTEHPLGPRLAHALWIG